MKSISTFIASLTVVGAAFASNFPPEVEAVMDANRSKATVIYIDKLDEQQKQFYWKGVTRNPAGYFEQEVEPQRVGLIQRMKGRMTTGSSPKHLKPLINLQNANGIKYVGEVSESSTRSNMFFRDRSGSDVMLTVYNLAAAGAKVYVVTELLNVSVNGAKGTLNLSVAKDGSEAMWTLAWESKGVNHDLYINDKVDSHRRPTKRPQDIIDIAQQIVRSSAGAVTK